jgi:hypothetical protein
MTSEAPHFKNLMRFFVRTLYRMIMNKYNTVGRCVLTDGKLKVLQTSYRYKIFLYRVIIKKRNIVTDQTNKRKDSIMAMTRTYIYIPLHVARIIYGYALPSYAELFWIT